MRLILDAGALIALDRNDSRMWMRYARASRVGQTMLSHGGVVGQAWRLGGPKQARLARALHGIAVKPLDDALGRAAGVLLAMARGSDVIDAALVALAEEGDVVLTSDVNDIARLAEVRGRDIEIVRV